VGNGGTVIVLVNKRWKRRQADFGFDKRQSDDEGEFIKGREEPRGLASFHFGCGGWTR
jgi:hypothetical protein